MIMKTHACCIMYGTLTRILKSHDFETIFTMCRILGLFIKNILLRQNREILTDLTIWRHYMLSALSLDILPILTDCGHFVSALGPSAFR